MVAPLCSPVGEYTVGTLITALPRGSLWRCGRQRLRSGGHPNGPFHHNNRLADNGRLLGHCQPHISPRCGCGSGSPPKNGTPLGAGLRRRHWILGHCSLVHLLPRFVDVLMESESATGCGDTPLHRVGVLRGELSSIHGLGVALSFSFFSLSISLSLNPPGRSLSFYSLSPSLSFALSRIFSFRCDRGCDWGRSSFYCSAHFTLAKCPLVRVICSPAAL